MNQAAVPVACDVDSPARCATPDSALARSHPRLGRRIPVYAVATILAMLLAAGVFAQRWTVPLTSLLLGASLGARHALEPDHLAAVSALAVDRPGVRRGAWLGMLWGIGHSVSLLGIGLVLCVLSTSLPSRIADLFELFVALMLVALGARAMLRAARTGEHGPRAAHSHGGVHHTHAGSLEHAHAGGLVLSTRPLLVGMLHGLAGSGALTALAMAELPSTAARLAFVALFGLGSVCAMAAISGLAGWPLARVTRGPASARCVFGAAGLLSAVTGVLWGIPLLGRIFS